MTDLPFKAYLVGGAVRDALLGEPVKDRDWVVVGATPEQMRAEGFRQVGAEFPVFLHPETHEEYALARTERKQGSGYHGFVCDFSPDITLEQDLERRDLTINAIAQQPDGTLVDPFDGQSDLERRLLRHVSPAFSEDPLRVIRVARFAARLAPYGFQVHPDTTALMRTMVAQGMLADLTPQRVWQDLEKALLTNKPSVFFRILDDLGALEPVLPELSGITGARDPAGALLIDTLDKAAMSDSALAARFALMALATADQEATDRLATRLQVSNALLRQAQVSRQWLPILVSASAPDAEQILALFDDTKAWHGTGGLTDLLAAARVICQPEGSDNFRAIWNALEKARNVTAEPLVQAGLKGPEIGRALARQRVSAIATALSGDNAPGGDQ